VDFTMRTSSLLTLLLPLVAACAVESSDGSSATSDADRGGLGKADLVGSCQHPVHDLCGGRGTGNCWCDDLCVDYGDCCSDAELVCDVELPEPEGDACGGLLGLTCDDGELCSFAPDQSCGGADQLGSCEAMPEACIELFAPVCGCDGTTYSNSCHAAGAGTSVAHEGECEPPPPGQFCGGIAGIQCPAGQICVDDGNDDCDPALGGADCGGVCIVDEPEPEPEPEQCKVAGCSSEMCVPPDGPDFSICIFQPWYACLELTECGNFGDEGACGWQPTPEYLACLASFGQ
jgi:eight-cysteine-cluster-containing protein